MRVLFTVALGACVVTGLAAPSWAQTYRVGSEVDQIILDQGKDVDPITYPEDVVRGQLRDLNTYTTTLLNQRAASTPPLGSPDLPSPYTTSVRTTAGYYRVTLTEPLLDSEVLR